MLHYFYHFVSYRKEVSVESLAEFRLYLSRVLADIHRVAKDFARKEWNSGLSLSGRRAGFLKVPSKVSGQKRIWDLVLPIALLALMIGTTVGEVRHHHANFSPGPCPICHVSHQAIEPPVASARATILVPTGPGPEPQRYIFIASPAERHIAARAPPA
jgi:hypothetical protein